MDYSKLVAVTGLPGLHELISSKNDGAIVRSLDDNTTRFISSRSHNFSQLESIEVFTQKENVNLADIFHAIEKSNEKFPDEKDANAVKKYFQKVFPEMDFEKVYDSDRKKMLKWFEILKKHNVEIKLSESVEDALPEEPKEEKSVAKKITEKENTATTTKEKKEKKK